MKCCKVIPFYFGERRRSFKTEYDVLELAEYQYENIKKTDPGVPVDVIIVNNSLDSKIGNSFLNKINNKKIKTGKTIVIEGNNIGLSFGAHSLAYQKFKKEYKYWFFTEDDIIFNLNGYYKNFIDHLSTDNNLAFVAGTGTDEKATHAHGGVGCTESFYLNKVWEKYGCLPHYTKDAPVLSNYKHTHINNGEIPFTNCYIKMGYKIESIGAPKPYIRWSSKDSPILNEIDFKKWGDSTCVKGKG